MLARRALAVAVWVACALAGWTLAARAEEDHVVVLGDKNLDDTVNSNQFVLVEFYAPWCGHCKALEPEYKKAAAELKDFEPKVILAKLDATAEKESAQAHGIQGFPTLKWFVNGKATEYGGGRTADTIVSWIKKKTGPPCKAIGSKAELDAFKESAEVVVVGAFKTKESAKAFESAALADDSVAYGLVLGDAPEDVKQALELKQAEGVVLFKKFDEGRADFTGDLADTDAVAKFVSGNELPLIVAFSQSTAPKIFGGAVKRHLLLFVDSSKDKETSDFKDTARPVAKETRGDYLFVTIDKSDSRVLEFFGITEADLPTARIVELNDAGMKKFKLLGAGAVTEESIRSTIKAHGAGELKPDLKSEEPPADNNGPVRVLTGKSFRDELKGKDVFVEFYAPWCGHCKKLAPIWDELGEKFKGKGASVVIAKMDATANEVDGVNIQGFPTLKLFRKDSDEAVDYDGERTLDGLTEFLEKQVPDSCKASA